MTYRKPDGRFLIDSYVNGALGTSRGRSQYSLPGFSFISSLNFPVLWEGSSERLQL